MDNASRLYRREAAKKLIILLSVLLVLLWVIYAIFSLNIKRVKIEAGEAIDAAKIVGKEHAEFESGFDPDCVNHPGVYNFRIISENKSYKVRLKVKDTKAPEVIVKNVYFAVGSTLPDPLEFIDEVYEPDKLYGEYTVSLDNLTYKLNETYEVGVVYYDASGNRTQEYPVRMTLIRDETPPVIDGVSDIISYVGEAVSYKNNITLRDNCTGKISLRIDDSSVNINAPGDYKVIYYATDAVGNVASAEAVVHIYAGEITKEMLNQKISSIISNIISDNMTKEEMCRAVYNYVQGNIQYTSTSDKSSYIRAAYDSLFVSGVGDCYSYFSAAKAFLNYLNIENMDIQRLSGYTVDTHYWSLVNIGSESDPVWYHFDCTRLRAEYNHSGCLLTDSQIEAYNKVRPNFYRYDKSKYPESSQRVITPTPELDLN